MKKSLLGLFAVALVAGGTGGVQAQSTIRSAGGSGKVIEVYQAYIGQDDIRNSSGGRLTLPWQVIRQDRANYHKFNQRDDQDEGDSFFAKEANRAAMERMLRAGSISPQAGRAIVRGNVLVRVEVRGTGGKARSVHVTVVN